MTTKKFIEKLEAMQYGDDELNAKKLTWNDTNLPSNAVAYGWNEAIQHVQYVLTHGSYLDDYPDTEADGIVFCGKCGKKKEL